MWQSPGSHEPSSRRSYKDPLRFLRPSGTVTSFRAPEKLAEDAAVLADRFSGLQIRCSCR